MGTQMAVSVLVCGAIGWFIDSKADSTPIGLLVGLIVGSAIGLFQFLRAVRQPNKRDQDGSTKVE
jgi:F0F1-type ATP synthase assembly protein I